MEEHRVRLRLYVSLTPRSVSRTGLLVSLSTQRPPSSPPVFELGINERHWYLRTGSIMFRDFLMCC
ncbi:hypothetical protein M427DRAFT_57714 [Gonapodya prolifera JEL478]|uniref:Uncharacterized protein n=1 Tax=Gonapodya prolifera (strain JEL478) TaxID=1344416 RepID=A0A139ABU7_GONPJ|nr:hypothetical protein M427DRAFT_57709 [Gonapodya prolifera JEL478]KXS14245.1 hypothetical protein M427DRAFT_57714 [Gonapodya prolifera JEL478]|eukprot:KXS14240.1 hypothetical protein M427DRAFT_57709 [Gonapodya prolifera JEL478]